MTLPIFYYPQDYSRPQMMMEGDVVKHIAQVLRMKTGDQLQLTDGKGTVTDVSINSISKKTVEVNIASTKKYDQPNPQLHLAIAFTKNASRNEWLLEKATELGVTTIQPLITKRSERVHTKEDRWQNILVSAMLQSQQYHLPILEKPKELKLVIAETKAEAIKLIAHCEYGIERQQISVLLIPDNNTVALIGPEGDFTREEIEMAMQNDFTGIDLGSNRLRTETAAMAVCAYFKMMNP